MKGTMTNKLPKDFIESDEYCVIEPGLTKFNKDQIISHKELLEHLKTNDINTLSVLPHMSSKSTIDLSVDTSNKDYDIMTNKIQKLLDDTEEKMSTLIEEYNEKYEDNEDVYQIETCDLSNLFSQLSDFCEDHQ
tara:strand:- start:4025 stop:4426 length:402 start_codon:yes stop_codon:yes gene_type:complete